MTMRLAIIAVGILMLATPAMADTADPARGKALAEKQCARCHAIGAEDTSTKPDAPAFRVLATKWPLENLEEALAEGIVVGHPDMPVFEFEPRQISDLLSYIGSISR